MSASTEFMVTTTLCRSSAQPRKESLSYHTLNSNLNNDFGIMHYSLVLIVSRAVGRLHADPGHFLNC